MIWKLRQKFILIAMTSLLIVITAIIGSINIYMDYNMNKNANGMLSFLAENDGSFLMLIQHEPPNRRSGFNLQMTAETPFETRYFTARMDTDGNIEVDTRNIAAITADQAEQYTREVLSGGKTIGFEGVYKYLVVRKMDGVLVIFLDCHLQMQSTSSFLWSSCLIALLSLLVMFALLTVLSKYAIKPVIESTEKQKQFITDAGHEIKTPLAIISANTDVLEISHGKSEWTESIRKQTGRLDELVKYLLTLSKMEEEKIHLSFSDFSMSDLVRDTAASFETLAERQGKNVALSIQPGLTLYGDENGLRQVVSILLDNAVKYSGDAGEIKVSLHGQVKSISLDVRNTSDSIPKGDLNRLFDRFYRADSSRSRESGGYGIGLSIAKAIVQAHKGKITVRREDELWICFSAVFLKGG